MVALREEGLEPGDVVSAYGDVGGMLRKVKAPSRLAQDIGIVVPGTVVVVANWFHFIYGPVGLEGEDNRARAAGTERNMERYIDILILIMLKLWSRIRPHIILGQASSV